MNAPVQDTLAPSADPRAAQRLAWARAATGEPALELARASTDAGFRSYWRSVGVTPSGIVMDSPPGLEDVRPWLRVHDLLDAGGVHLSGPLVDHQGRVISTA